MKITVIFLLMLCNLCITVTTSKDLSSEVTDTNKTISEAHPLEKNTNEYNSIDVMQDKATKELIDGTETNFIKSNDSSEVVENIIEATNIIQNEKVDDSIINTTTMDPIVTGSTMYTENTENTVTDKTLETVNTSTDIRIIATTDATVTEETTGAEDNSNLICSVCECKDGMVDCSNKNLKDSFEITDWDGLIHFRPVSVDLSLNPLTSLTRISNITTLKYLNISNCKIETIEPATFSYLKDLVKLDLSGNMLVTSAVNKRVFVGILDPKMGILPFPNLQYLNLANNDIHSLSQDIFAFMPGLRTLDMSGNPLGYIDQITMGALTDLEDLKVLNLSGCKLETLPIGIFSRHHRLKRLDLSNNKFNTVPISLGEAVSLEFLDFGRNPVEVFNKSRPISNLKKLKELHLNHLTKLQTITDGALGGLENLEILNLSFNPKLTDLEDGFLLWTDEHTEQEKWPQLRELYLNNNNLSRIYSGYLERWDILSKVDLSNNPYLCNCNNQWIVDVFVPMISSSPSNMTLGNMVCKKPKEMKGLSFTQLHNASKELVCPELQESTSLQVPDMAILLGIIIGVFVTFPIVLVVILLWRRGFFARCKSRRIESDSEDEETNAFVKLRTLNGHDRILKVK